MMKEEMARKARCHLKIQDGNGARAKAEKEIPAGDEGIHGARSGGVRQPDIQSFRMGPNGTKRSRSVQIGRPKISTRRQESTPHPTTTSVARLEKDL